MAFVGARSVILLLVVCLGATIRVADAVGGQFRFNSDAPGGMINATCSAYGENEVSLRDYGVITLTDGVPLLFDVPDASSFVDCYFTFQFDIMSDEMQPVGGHPPEHRQYVWSILKDPFHSLPLPCGIHSPCDWLIKYPDGFYIDDPAHGARPVFVAYWCGKNALCSSLN